MVNVLKRGILVALLLVVAASFAFGQDKKEEKTFAYVGAKKCMPCHMNPKKGAQYKQWQTTKHSKAYETLGTDEAKAVAKKAGLEGDPQKSDECLKCHVTGYEAKDDLKTDKYDMTDGVWCETCHGPGSEYWKMPVMMGINKGTMQASDYGLTVKPTKETCVECHNENNPTHKGFDFETMYKKIAHPFPQSEG